VVKDARNLLNLFGVDADARRCEIREMLRETLGKSLDIPDLRFVYSEGLEANLTITSASA
jgi:hypothetical protein